MEITSLSYLAFILLAVVIYYITPAKVRWCALLIFNFIYLLISGSAILLIYPVASIFVAWLCTNRMEARREAGDENAEKKCKQLLWIAVLANLGVLIVLKYLNLGVFTFNAIAMRVNANAAFLNVIHFMVPVGVSFYTMSVLGYIYDVYYGISKPEKNLIKLLTFGTYFPLMISGPIVRYKDINGELFGANKLSNKNITFGAQRILIGFFKVLVISERLSLVAEEVFGNFQNYYGRYTWFSMWIFAFQLYANFSGSMDIVIGLSQMFGINLPENFRQPFFSETIQEFWQRWHITLGAWLKDYILYPVLRTKTFMNMPQKWKDKLGKKKAKQYTTFIAMAILWFAVGLWHGGAWKYIWGTGLLQCIYIIISELCTPAFKSIKAKLKINEKGFLFVQFKRIRTFILISIGLMFFNSNSLTDGFRMLGHAFCIGRDSVVEAGFGLGRSDWMILAMSFVLWLLMSIINEYSKQKDVREVIAARNIVIRWAIFYALIIFIVIFGYYGPGYDAAQFIYQGF